MCTVKEVLDFQPEEEFVVMEDVLIAAYTEVKSDKNASSNHKRLVAEARRVIGSLPLVNIPELYGQTMKFEFRFEIR